MTFDLPASYQEFFRYALGAILTILVGLLYKGAKWALRGKQSPLGEALLEKMTLNNVTWSGSATVEVGSLMVCPLLLVREINWRGNDIRSHLSRLDRRLIYRKAEELRVAHRRKKSKESRDEILAELEA